MNPSKDTFQTTDLNKAAFLVHEGARAEMFRQGATPKGRPFGGWKFEDSQRVQQLMNQYDQDNALVSPKAFHHTLARVRRDMYTFLGINKKG